MYFIHRGTVEVVSDDDEPIIFDTMGEGRFFGEVSPRPASIRLEPIDLKVEVSNWKIPFKIYTKLLQAKDLIVVAVWNKVRLGFQR